MTDKIAGILEKAWYSARYLYVQGLLSESEQRRVYDRLRKKAKKLSYEAYEVTPLTVGFRRVL